MKHFEATILSSLSYPYGGLMMEGRACVGGHITLIFSIHDDSEILLEQGSRGAGLALDRGVEIIAHASEGNGILTSTTPSGQKIHQHVLEELSTFIPEVLSFDWTINQTLSLPRSQGFGLSAAGAIACALSMQRALGEPDEISRARSIHIAHRVERQLSGGLGDVSALHAGGVELRLEPGCPQLHGDLGGSGAVVSWFKKIPVVVCWRTSASRHTSSYIDDGQWKLAIRAAGEQVMFGLREGRWDESRWSELLSASASFADLSGLINDADRTELLHLVGGALISAGLIDSPIAARLCMLGESVIILPTDFSKPLPDHWQRTLVESLISRGLGASEASVIDDALNLRSPAQY